MEIYCPYTGKPVRARGLLQITECYQPQISDKQAYDPVYAMEWSIPKMKDKETCRQLWTTCRWYYD